MLILGTRGVPAAHGGFETFAENLALFLVERGWKVTVYCQKDVAPGQDTSAVVDEWRGIRRITIGTQLTGPLGTILFDWSCIRHAIKEKGALLVLGYNTAIFTLLFRLRGRSVLMNMDGFEWKRAKWSLPARVWFYLNEWIGAVASTKLIADHPVIADHLATRRSRSDIVTIPYGANRIAHADATHVKNMGLVPGKYFLSVSRIEPENSILEMVQAYSTRERKATFVCLGKFEPASNAYHARVLEASKGNVLFPGAIYVSERVRALRFYTLAYCHGHTVGGTNPSLVEALGAGNAVIAHDNPFNRWVAGADQFYFSGQESCADIFTELDTVPVAAEVARESAKQRFAEMFAWPDILKKYESLSAPYASSAPRGGVRHLTSRKLVETEAGLGSNNAFPDGRLNPRGE